MFDKFAINDIPNWEDYHIKNIANRFYNPGTSGFFSDFNGGSLEFTLWQSTGNSIISIIHGGSLNTFTSFIEIPYDDCSLLALNFTESIISTTNHMATTGNQIATTGNQIATTGEKITNTFKNITNFLSDQIESNSCVNSIFILIIFIPFVI